MTPVTLLVLLSALLHMVLAADLPPASDPAPADHPDPLPADPCAADRRATTELAWNAIAAALYPTAHRLLIAVEATFSCSPVPAAELSLYLQSRGALAALEGDTDRAALYLASARSLGPLDPRLGDDLLALADTVPADEPSAITLDRPDVPTLVDGRQVVEDPVPVVAGVHLVQVLGPGDVVTWALPVRVPPGMDITVETGVLIPAWERDPDTRLEGDPGRWHPAALVVSGALAAGSGVLLGMASREKEQFVATATPTAAEASYTRNHSLAVAGIATGSGALVALGLVYPW